MRRSLSRSGRPDPAVKTVLAAVATAAAVLVVVSAPSFAASPQDRNPAPLNLSLQDCIARALAGNLEVSIEAMNPEIDGEAVFEVREKYYPELKLSFMNQDRTVLGTWGVEGESYRSRYDNYSLDVTQRLITGAVVGLSFSHSMSNTARAYTTINPSYYSQLQVQLTQPLLKGFGPRTNRIETKRAEYRADISRAALKAALLQMIFDIETAYWNLVDGRGNLKVQELSLEQSREILKRNREGARVGTKSAVEVLSAETEVAGWEDSVLSARRQVEQAEDRLRQVVNLPPGAGAEPPPPIVPTDRPDSGKPPIAYQEALAIALAERPEVLAAEQELASSLGDVGYARNQALPELNLSLSAWNPGQSGVKSIYENNDPFNGRIIGIVRGSRGESIRDVFNKWRKSWMVGLDLTLPLANVFSRAGLAKAKLQNKQAVLKVEESRTAIGHEIASALKESAACERRIASTAAYRALLEKRLEAEIQRYQVGLAGSEWLFTYQRQLAQARTGESRALVDSKIAQAALDKAMGTSLKTKGVKFRDYDF